jgi:hypothetical protein
MREWTLAVLEARMIQPKWQVILVQPSFDSLSHGLAELNLCARRVAQNSQVSAGLSLIFTHPVESKLPFHTKDK